MPTPPLLTPEQMASYFKRSYAAVDGLWFMKVEGRLGFDAALDIDEEVWRVLPKIQARMLREMLGLGRGGEALRAAILTKFALDGFRLKCAPEMRGTEMTLRIEECPWHAVMIKSGRTDLSPKVGERICQAEYSTFAREFVNLETFEMGDRICAGGEGCVLRWRWTED